MILISVHDVKAETWSPPVCMPTKAAAMRDFGTACSRSQTVMSQSPVDFDLWMVGTWEVVDGKDPTIAFCEPKIHLANGADYVRKED